MNIQDFKFYRKNNRYYFESELLEGRIELAEKKVIDVNVTNGDADTWKEIELVRVFNNNIAAVLAAESIK